MLQIWMEFYMLFFDKSDWHYEMLDLAFEQLLTYLETQEYRQLKKWPDVKQILIER